MEKQELIKKVNSVLAEEFEVEESIITPDANIKQTLELDSLSLVDMVALIENEFGVKIWLRYRLLLPCTTIWQREHNVPERTDIPTHSSTPSYRNG